MEGLGDKAAFRAVVFCCFRFLFSFGAFSESCFYAVAVGFLLWAAGEFLLAAFSAFLRRRLGAWVLLAVPLFLEMIAAVWITACGI
jgi:hypothetical protein